MERALLPLRVRIRHIALKDYSQPLGVLAGLPDMTPSEEIYDGEELSDAMLVFCGLSNQKLDPQFSPDYMFDFFGKIHGVKPEKLKERKEELFTYFGIKDFAHKKMKELSTGMGQKAAIAVSLVHDPDIVIFDEPTNGLDVVTARSVTDYLKRLKEEGKLVIISTHIMSEAEKLCDRIGVIIDGRKVMEGHLEDILRATQTEDLEDAFFELYSQVKGGGEDA